MYCADFETNIKKMDLILEQVNLREFSGRIQGKIPDGWEVREGGVGK